MYVEIKENKLLSWCENPYLDYEFVDIDYSTFDQNKYEVQDGQLKDISQTPEYIAENLLKYKQNAYHKIVSKYSDVIKNGVFQIDSQYYGNMAWYDTWTKAAYLYESGLILSDTFTVRLYKKVSNEYKNYNTTQNLVAFKQMIQVLNSQQFLKYQPIRNNIISQLKLAQNIDAVNNICGLIETSFGDIINETTTIVQDGE